MRGIVVGICVLLIVAAQGKACSICYSGDPAQMAQGGEGCECFGFQKNWSLSLDARTVANESGVAVQEIHTQTQFGAGLYRRLGSRSFAFVRVPFSYNGLSSTHAETIESTGLGDIDLVAGTNFKATFLGFIPGATLGLKVPTGNNNVKSDVVQDSHANRLDHLDHGTTVNGRLPEHCQIGTGSVDGLMMAHLRRGSEMRWEITLGYRLNGENSFDFHYGNSRWFDITASRNLTTPWSVGIGGRLRHADHDLDHGAVDSESGGFLSSMLLESEYRLSSRLRVAVYSAIPVVNELHGTQDEKPMFSAGLVGSF
ncbi:MAG: hypothetical protein IPP40_11310 [bacterium]|nr:hypothetical protein [bacterium]